MYQPLSRCDGETDLAETAKPEYGKGLAPSHGGFGNVFGEFQASKSLLNEALFELCGHATIDEGKQGPTDRRAVAAIQ